MKILKVICLLLVLTTCISCVVACSKKEKEEEDNRVINVFQGEEGGEPQTGSINIITNGGELDADSIKNFKSAVKLIPRKEGYVFAGWYSNEDLTNKIKPASPTKEQISKGTAYAKWLLVETKSYSIRMGSEVTITDSGRQNQPMDVVDFSSDYNVKDLINSGYKKIVVTLSADVMERDDGYQYIFLYSDTSCASHGINSIMDAFDKYVFSDDDEADPSLLYMHKFTHGGDQKNSSWGTVNFTVTLDATRLKDDLYIRYGASGKYNDDWCNKNIEVTITPIP